MNVLGIVIFLAGAGPWWLAWRANRRTVLVHALAWGLAAWATWGAAVLIAGGGREAVADVIRYLALCLSGCAMVAVLGARQPGASAWHFVVAGLLAVLLLPLAEQFLSGGPLHLAGYRALLVGGVLLVGVVNYLPTRLGPAALVLALGSILEIIRLTQPNALNGEGDPGFSLGWWLVILTPWVAFAGIHRRAPAGAEVDRIWLAFRDRFGLVWGQRLREQFNNAGAHAGWPVVLTWRGLRRLPGQARADQVPEAALRTTLEALMKRFGSAAEANRPETAG